MVDYDKVVVRSRVEVEIMVELDETWGSKISKTWIKRKEEKRL